MRADRIVQNQGLDGSLRRLVPECTKEGMIQDTQGLMRLEELSQTRRKGVALLGHDDEDPVLVKDQPSATFEMLLKKAEQDGRLTGKHRCKVCGMRYKKEREASACCCGITK
jgi:hypothetical protein